MNEILNKIQQEYDLNENELSFIKTFSEDFIENNSKYLNFDISKNDNFSKYLQIKSQSINVENKQKLENIEEVVHLVVSYLKEKKRIIIITDSDLDGTSCRAIATSFDLYLKRKFNYTYIFEQYFSAGHTHGICFSQIDELLNNDTDSDALIITADNGINNREEVLLIKEKYPNTKIIITDHHIANEGEDVFGYVDYVVNPEAIGLDRKSRITQIEFNNQKIKTSFSGAHTFYFLFKELLEQLKITDEELHNEMLLVALFSDIGDIINFGPDVMNLFIKNTEKIKDIYFIKNYQNSLDSFNTFPDEGFDYKMNEYISKVVTILNSTRRTNSILLQYAKLGSEEFSKWLFEKFEFDTEKDLITLNKKTGEKIKILTLLEELNRSSKKIYNHFFPTNENRYNVLEEAQFKYSYIKEMPILLLLSHNHHKTKNDTYFLEEAYSILSKMDLLKKAFRNFILDNELYISDKFELFETYFSKKDGILREILSIQAFIENDERKSLLTLAQNQPNVINGSLRSKSIDFKELFNNHPKVAKLKEKYGLTIDIFGHAAAAGIFFNKENISYPILFDFLTEFENILKDEGVTLKGLTYRPVDPAIFEDIDAKKMLDIIKKYFIIGPNSLMKEFKVIIEGKDLKETFGGDLETKSSKTGTKYVNVRDKKGNTFLLFPEEDVENWEELIFVSKVNFKFNQRNNAYFCEFSLDII